MTYIWKSSIDEKTCSQKKHAPLIEDNNPTAQVECNHVSTVINRNKIVSLFRKSEKIIGGQSAYESKRNRKQQAH